jgi:hypothetical protein
MCSCINKHPLCNTRKRNSRNKMISDTLQNERQIRDWCIHAIPPPPGRAQLRNHDTFGGNCATSTV